MSLRLKRHLRDATIAAALIVLLLLPFRPRPIAFNLDAVRLQGIDFIGLPATNRLTFTPSVEHLFCWRQTPWMRVIVPANYPQPTNPPAPWTVSRDGTNVFFMARAVPRGRWDRLPLRFGRIEFPPFSLPVRTNTGFPLQIQTGYGRELRAFSTLAVVASSELNAPLHFTGLEARQKIDYLVEKRLVH